MDYTANRITVNCNPLTLAAEQPIEDELFRLKSAFNMEETESSKKAREATATKAEVTLVHLASSLSESMSKLGLISSHTASSSSSSSSQHPAANQDQPKL